MIDPLPLPPLPLSDHKFLPECLAVYFVLDSNRILYVEQDAVQSIKKMLKNWLKNKNSQAD
jgi:hypothetical protein